MVTMTCNVPHRTKISEETLARILRDQAPPGFWAGHIAAFFVESPIGEIERFMKRNGVSGEILAAYYRRYVQALDSREELESLFHAR